MNQILMALAILPVIFILRYIYNKDQNPEPKKLVNKMFWWSFGGTFFAVILELLIEPILPTENSKSLFELFFAIFIGIAFVEELLKWLVVKTKGYGHEEFDEVYDAIVYSVYASLGFACIENILYVFTGGIETGILRAILSVPGHACDGVFMGYFFGLAKQNAVKEGKSKEGIYLFLSLFMPTLLHTVYDFLIFGIDDFHFSPFLFYGFVLVQYIFTFVLIKKVSKKNIRLKEPKVENIPHGIHYCANCGRPCETRYCPNCGYKNF